MSCTDLANHCIRALEETRPIRQPPCRLETEDSEASVQVEPSRRPDMKGVLTRESCGTYRDIADDSPSDITNNNNSNNRYYGKDIQPRPGTGDQTIDEKENNNNHNNDNSSTKENEGRDLRYSSTTTPDEKRTNSRLKKPPDRYGLAGKLSSKSVNTK